MLHHSKLSSQGRLCIESWYLLHVRVHKHSPVQQMTILDTLLQTAMPHLLPVIIAALSLAGVAHSQADCSLAITKVPYNYTTGEYAGCYGETDTFSCAGKCFSAMEPRVYRARYATVRVSAYTYIISKYSYVQL